MTKFIFTHEDGDVFTVEADDIDTAVGAAVNNDFPNAVTDRSDFWYGINDGQITVEEGEEE